MKSEETTTTTNRPNKTLLTTTSTTTSTATVTMPVISSSSTKIYHNLDTFCNICKKELCNKYFLKTHLANKHGIPVELHTPTEVKAAVTGSGRAPKQQVGEMVKRILKLTEIPKPADAADSLAIAICNAWRQGPNLASSETSAQAAWRSALAQSRAKKRS